LIQIKGIVRCVADNPLMRTLRHFTFISRLVLAWFVLSLGVAVASPIVKPQDILLVCTGSGAMKMLVKAADGSASDVASNGMDCPLCAALGAPPPQVTVRVLSPMGLAYVADLDADAPHPRRSAASPPPRGPPASL
jgi:hypothetical protein